MILAFRMWTFISAYISHSGHIVFRDKLIQSLQEAWRQFQEIITGERLGKCHHQSVKINTTWCSIS